MSMQDKAMQDVQRPRLSVSVTVRVRVSKTYSGQSMKALLLDQNELVKVTRRSSLMHLACNTDWVPRAADTLGCG